MRVGVISCGGAGRSHVKGYIENGVSVKDVYLCDVDGSRAAEVAKEFGIPVENIFHGDECHQDLVGRVDIVSIATPPFERLKIVEDLSQHVRGILIEKPIAHRIEDAVRIVDIVKGYGVLDAMVYNLRFSPVFNYLRSTVGEDFVLTVYHEFGFDYFSSSGWRGNSELGGDHVVELDIHVIDYVRYLLGEPRAIQSYAYKCTGKGMCRDIYIVFYYNRSVANISIRHGTGRSGDRYFYMDISLHKPGEESCRAFTEWPNFRLFCGSREVDIGEKHVWRNIYMTSIIRNFLNSVNGSEKPRADSIDGYRDLVIAFRIRESLSKGLTTGDYVIGEAIEIQYER